MGPPSYKLKSGLLKGNDLGSSTTVLGVSKGMPGV